MTIPELVIGGRDQVTVEKIDRCIFHCHDKEEMPQDIPSPLDRLFHLMRAETHFTFDVEFSAPYDWWPFLEHWYGEHEFLLGRIKAVGGSFRLDRFTMAAPRDGEGWPRYSMKLFAYEIVVLEDSINA